MSNSIENDPERLREFRDYYDNTDMSAEIKNAVLDRTVLAQTVNATIKAADIAKIISSTGPIEARP